MKKLGSKIKQKVGSRISAMNQRALDAGVSPKVLFWIYWGSAIPFYGGAFLMLLGSGIKFSFSGARKIDFSGLNINNTVTMGFFIWAIAVLMPYLYVAIWGSGMKWYIRAMVIVVAAVLVIWPAMQWLKLL